MWVTESLGLQYCFNSWILSRTYPKSAVFQNVSTCSSFVFDLKLYKNGRRLCEYTKDCRKKQLTCVKFENRDRKE